MVELRHEVRVDHAVQKQMFEREVDFHLDNFGQVLEYLQGSCQLWHAIHKCHVLIVLAVEAVRVDFHEKGVSSLGFLEALSHFLLQKIDLG